jgi:formate C-acetyltransferase
VLELTLHNGIDPRTGKQLGLPTGSAESFRTFEDLFQACQKQLRHFIEIKLKGNQIIERMYATLMPAPFLSVLIDDCSLKGLDYDNGGARYNNTFIQVVGIGSLTDSFAAIKEIVFDTQALGLAELVKALDDNFAGQEPLRQRSVNRTHKYGNDDDYADGIMTQLFGACFSAIDGRPNTKGGQYRVEMLPTTCHVYFGSVTGATPDGRKAGMPLS